MAGVETPQPELAALSTDAAPDATLDAEAQRPLEPKQQRFVEQYIIDLNGSAAAIRAGYAPRSSKEIAYELLTRPHVRAAVERAKLQRAVAVGVTQAMVLDQMAALANSSVAHYVIDDDGQVQLAEGAPSNAMSAIQSIRKKTTQKVDRNGEVSITYDVELKLWDKPTPLKLMGRHTGLFPDRVEHTGKDGGPIETVTKIERVIINDDGTPYIPPKNETAATTPVLPVSTVGDSPSGNAAS